MSNDIRFQIECTARDLVEMCVETFGWTPERAMDELYASQTFRMLEDERSGLYYQSPVYVFDCLKTEFTTGKIG